MRYAAPALFLILALIAFQYWLNNINLHDPAQEAESFLSDIEAGNVSKVVRHFGSNICHCPKKYGWGSYLAYQSSQEPNLAFLLGHPFEKEKYSANRIATPEQAKHGIPWEEPEDYVVDVQLKFDPEKYIPLLLPRAMASGKNMSWAELQKFINSPDDGLLENLSLRLRPSLKRGSITFDTSTIEPDVRAEFKFLQLGKAIPKDNPPEEKNYSATVAQILKKEAAGQEGVSFTVADAGQVLFADKAIGDDKVEAVLPRLKAITIRLHVVRRGKLQPWTIAHFLLINPKLVNGSRLAGEF